MSAEKLVTVYGALGNVESSYNGGGTLSPTTDGILMREPATLAISPIKPGERGQAPAGMGQMKDVADSGDQGEITIPVEGRGAGAAYSESVTPPDLHSLLRAAGLVGTVTTTAGSEKWEYVPQAWTGGAPDFASMVMELYARGQKYPFQGIYADMAFSVEDGGIAQFDFPLVGFAGDPVDVTLPSIAYDQTADPPKADALAFTLGNFTSGKVREISFAMNRSRSPRGTYGWAPGGREPTLEVLLEATALSTSSPYHEADSLDPYKLRKLKTALAVSFQVGSVQYNQFSFSGAAAQIREVQEEEEEGVALWRLVMKLAQSTPTATDDFAWTWD